MTTTVPVRLHRTLYHRLFGGPILQPLYLTLWVLMLVGAGARAARGEDGGALIATIILAVVIAVIWGLGATGWAEADERGIRWRSYLPTTVGWGDVRGVEGESHGTGLQGVRTLLVVQTATRRRSVGPAAGRGPNQRRFLADLQQLAAARAGRD